MISPELSAVILETLRLEEWDLQDDTLASEVPGWDSLSHVNVILAVEQRFGIRFKGMEVLSLANIGQLQRLVQGKMAAKEP